MFPVWTNAGQIHTCHGLHSISPLLNDFSLDNDDDKSQILFHTWKSSFHVIALDEQEMCKLNISS